MKCPKCGCEIHAGDRFCEFCGKRTGNCSVYVPESPSSDMAEPGTPEVHDYYGLVSTIR